MNHASDNLVAKQMADSIILLSTRALPIAYALLHNVHDGRQVRPEFRTSAADAVARRHGNEVSEAALLLARESGFAHAGMTEAGSAGLSERIRIAASEARAWFATVPQEAFESVSVLGAGMH